MKTITITITETLDKRAAEEARRRGISKSELIRDSLSSLLGPDASDESDDLWRSLAGFGSEGLTVETGEIDETVYGR